MFSFGSLLCRYLGRQVIRKQNKSGKTIFNFHQLPFHFFRLDCKLSITILYAYHMNLGSFNISFTVR